MEALHLRRADGPSVIPWSRPSTPETIETSSSVQRELTLAALQNNIDIRRYGLSYVLDVGANSRDPEKAAKIVNAITDAFMADQMNLKIDAARQASDWREEQIGRLRTQMNRASRAVQEYKARRDYRLPPKTDDQVGTEPGALSGQVDTGKEQPGTRREAVTLEELEVSAQAYRKIYESNLQAHADAVLRQSLQFTNARVITTAAVPRNPTFPRPRILIAIGALAGAMLGLGISLVRHSIDNTIWTPDDIERAEAIQNLSTLPPVPVQNALLSRVMSGHGTKLPQTNPMPALHFTPFIARSAYGQSVRDAISVIGRLQREKKIVTIGVTGIGGAAARSIVAGSLASAAVQSGRSAVIVDCDLDRRMLTNALTPGARYGLLEAMAGQCTLDQAVVTSVGETADVLPACSAVNEPSGSLAKNAASLKPVLDALAAKYHLVIVDLPNAADARADVLAAAPMVDAVICVIECGVATTTKLGLVMKSLRSVAVQPLGALLYACDEVSG